MFDLLVKRVAEKQLERLSHKDQKRVWLAIEYLRNDPFLGKKLAGELEGIYSLRVGTYRVLYEIYKDRILVVVLTVGHRQGVYK